MSGLQNEGADKLTAAFAVDGAPDCAGRNGAHELRLPFDLIEGNEHHGPYIVNSYGADVCDFYCMSNPSSWSVRNGGDSKPIWFTDAAENAAFMHRAANCHHELLATLKDAMRSSRKDFKLGTDGDRQHREAYAEQFAIIAKAEGRS